MIYPRKKYVEVAQSKNKKDYTEGQQFVTITCSSADPDKHFSRFAVYPTHYADLLTLLFIVMLADANCLNL